MKNTMKKPTYEAFVESVTESIKNFEYFVDWQKVESQKREHEIHLHMLNYIIGKEDIKTELRYLIERDPSIVDVFPILVATREKQITIFDTNKEGSKKDMDFSFVPSTISSTKEIDHLLYFLEQSGVIDMIQKQKIRSFPDYVFGLEVGMDTNARKNRGGKLMEDLVESFIEPIHDIQYLAQASHKKIKEAFGITLHKSLERRIFDFVIKKGNTYTFIETNFFNDGGTKVKSVVGEFKTVQEHFTKHHPEHQLIWVTDGKGWKKSLHPLQEAFRTMNTILNISMLNEGYLENNL